MKEIIENEFKITSILVNGYYTNYLTASVIEQFKNKQVMLWQDKNFYHSCKRLQLSFGVNLLMLLEDFIDDFDVLIIDKFKDNINSQETIDFIKTVSQSEKFKEKHFIFLISAPIKNQKMKLDDFINLKDAILDFSDEIYIFQRVDKSHLCDNLYILRNVKNEKNLLLTETIKGRHVLLEKIDE